MLPQEKCTLLNNVYTTANPILYGYYAPFPRIVLLVLPFVEFLGPRLNIVYK